jgi:predicted MFS family arabinose efflux permease
MNAPNERIFQLPFVRLLSVQPLAGFAICTFYLLPKFLATELRATPSQIGLVSAAFGVAGALAVPLLAVLLDRLSPRVLIVTACFVLAAAALGFVCVDHVGLLVLALRTAQGIAWAVLFTAGMMLTIRLSPPSRLAQAIGYYGVANLAMNAVAPAAAEIISDRVGWTPVFVLACAMGLLALLLAYGLPNERPSQKNTVRMSTLIRRPHTLVMACIVAIWGSAFGAMFIFYQPFALSLGIQKLRGFFIAYTLTAVFARVGTGNAVDRIGRRTISVLSLTLYGLVVLAMQALRPGLLEWFGAAFGLAHGFFFPAYSALIVERARPEERGKVMALSNAAFNAGLAASSVVLGSIAERDGYPHAFLAAGMVTLAGVGLLVATSPAKQGPAPSTVPRGPVQ